MLAGQSLECPLHKNKYHCIEKSYLSLNLSSMNLELIKYFCCISLSFLFVIEMFFADVPVLLAALNTSLKT